MTGDGNGERLSSAIPGQVPGRSAGAPLLEVRSLSKDFGRFRAVDDVSFQVGPGEVVGLLGANGAGKTTALRMALGLLAPSRGSIALMGGPPDRMARRSIGYVSQGLGLYADLSVSENVAFVASVYGGSPDLPEGMDAVADTLVGRLPLGRQRELAFACSVLHDPALLVLDEPTSGVGALARSRLWESIRERASAGVGVLVTTHYMQEALQCDRLLLMSGGRLVAQGSEAQIVGDTSAVLVHTDDWPRAFDALSAAGIPVMLSGTSVRVADVPGDRISALLAAAGIPARLEAVPATIEERMTVLAAGNRT